MLGKRSRPLQRATSKMQLTHGDGFPGMPAVEPLKEQISPFTPASGIPRQVIGFSPVSREYSDAVSSPRSVLCALGSGCSHARSPRSPFSGLGSLFSGSGYQEDQAFDDGGIGIVAVLDSVVAEDARSRSHAKEIAEDFLISPKPTEPIPINLPFSPCPAPSWKAEIQSEMMSSRNDGFQSNSNAWSFRGLHSCSNELSVCGALIDVEMEICDSIFSTASPASSCSENCSASSMPELDFLSACYFCKRHIGPGKDIYMYRGDKAFCSAECRYQQIMHDERKERCSASVPSTGVKHHGRLLSTTQAAA